MSGEVDFSYEGIGISEGNYFSYEQHYKKNPVLIGRDGVYR